MTIELKKNTLAALIEQSTQLHSDRIALSFTDEPPITYSVLKKEIEHLSQFLKEQGVGHGERVALLGENMPQWGIAYFAVATMGAIIVPILPDFHSSEIHHILRHSDAKIIFVSERFYHKVEDLDDLNNRQIILLNDFSLIKPNTSKDALRQLLDEGGKGLRKIRDWVYKFAGFVTDDVREDDVASIIYTSGTTGHSKGVQLTHKNIVSNTIASAEIPNVNDQDCFLSILPLAHVYECTLGLVLPLLCGASVYYVKKPPTAPVLLPALQQVRPTVMLTVPLIIEKMYKTRILPEIKKKFVVKLLYMVPVVRKRINAVAGKKLMATFGDRLRFFGVGGAALSSEVEQFLREAHFPYAIGYGLTETSPLIAGSNAQTTRFRAIGPLAKDVEVNIDHPDPKTGVGEVIVRGPNVMKGYYRDPERTAEVLSSDGWFRTGDLGRFDSDGYLYISGRLKNVLLGPSGENIYPEAIESVINRSEIVLESLVYMDTGQLVARVFLDYERLDTALRKGATETQAKRHIAEILDHLRLEVNSQLSSFSRLTRIIEQSEPFEKTPTQKIKRYLYTTGE